MSIAGRIFPWTRRFIVSAGDISLMDPASAGLRLLVVITLVIHSRRPDIILRKQLAGEGP